MQTDVVGIDTETFYDSKQGYSLKKMTTNAYIEDPRFRLLCVSLAAPDLNYAGPASEAPWDRVIGRPLCAHNVRFDRAVIREAVLRHHIPDLQTPWWFDTADGAAYLQGPRDLAGASDYFLGVKHSKQVRAAMDGRTLDQLGPDELAAFREYALQDAMLCRQLCEKIDPLWPTTHQRVSRLNTERGIRGIRIDVQKLNEAVEMFELAKFNLMRLLPWVPEEDALSLPAVWAECRKAGIPAPATLRKDDPVAEDWENTYSEQHAWVRAIRAFRRVVNFLCKLKTLKDSTSADGRYRYQLKYFGAAATGRFSGGGGFNLQNLPKKPLVLCKTCWTCHLADPEKLHACACGSSDFFVVDIRSLLLADEGCLFVISDLAQIEARLLLWRVRDEKTLALIRQGYSVYEAHARSTMGWTGGDLKKENKEVYAFAKARCLGLGYQCGSARFVGVAKSMAGLDLTPEEAKATVDAYREANPKIVAHWRWHHGWLLDSVRKGDATHDVELATGRVIHYHQPHWEQNDEGRYDIKAMIQANTPRSTKRLHGGVLTENEIQALGAGGLVNWIVGCEDAGVPYVFSVHDEVVCQAPEDRAKAAAAEADRQAALAFPFAPGCPIGTETRLSPHYIKD